MLCTRESCEMVAPTTRLNSAERAGIARVAEAMALPVFVPGSVWLAGAGPGDPGLITVLGLHAIASADAILYDALVNEALLQFARPSAELMYAGKRRGKPSAKQDDISRKLVALAR